MKNLGITREEEKDMAESKKTGNNTNNNALIARQNYIKSNYLIEARYRSSPFTDKILAAGLTYLVKSEGSITAELSAKEIMHLMGKEESGSMYTRINKCAKELSQFQMIIECESENRFEILNMFQKVSYDRGVLNMKFSEDMGKYISDLQSGTYQTFNLPLMMAFNETASLRLYELIKLVAYMATEDDEIATRAYSMAELLVRFNLVNTGTDKVQKALSDKNPDYEYIVNELATEVKCNNWDNFKRRILEPAVEEISNMSDYVVRYEKKRGSKSQKVVFFIKKKKLTAITNEEMLNMLQELKSYIKEDMELNDYYSLLRNSNYDVDHIKKCYDIAMESKSEIKDLVAWLHAAIMNPNLTKKKTRVKKASTNKFNNIDSREYDYDDLEKKLLNNCEN